MNPSNTEQQLEAELNRTGRNRTPISPLVRTRLDETYASLPDSAAAKETSAAAATMTGRSASSGRIEAAHTRRRLGTGLRRTAAVAASAFVLSAGLFASGFVSPAMADTIRDIPVIGSLFSKMEGDAGLRTAGERSQGMLVEASAAASDGVRMNVRETIFDGTRLAFAVDLTVPGIPNAGKLEEYMQSVNVNLDGIGDLDGVFYNTPEDKGGDTYGVLMNLPLNADQIRQLGDRFEGKVSISLVGQPQPLSVTVPFERIDAGRELHLSPGPSASDERYALIIDTLDVTASTVQLGTSLSLRDPAASIAEQEKWLLGSAYDIVDDQGQVLDVVGGEGSLEDGAMTYTSNYGADLSRAKFIVVKPYIRAEGTDSGAEKIYLEKLALKIDLKAAAGK
ncbi:DUF4179 domain-containing protein [Saccharibacillus qingshengii]|uniref:DUF4179 domain-containing protein n=1 Tax=Saccharibacillus qingshengii TaxID=1763540 RepID=UPI0015558C21|nr:DUF4179 domain-containing protein [Saccharibacillus qingshengii]